MRYTDIVDDNPKWMQTAPMLYPSPSRGTLRRLLGAIPEREVIRAMAIRTEAGWELLAWDGGKTHQQMFDLLKSDKGIEEDIGVFIGRSEDAIHWNAFGGSVGFIHRPDFVVGYYPDSPASLLVLQQQFPRVFGEAATQEPVTETIKRPAMVPWHEEP